MKTQKLEMELPNHAKQLLLQLNQQRAKGYLCDVIIVVENALFRAHKNILAASSIYFKSLILHDNLINLDTDMVNPSVFRQVLDFIYTGKLLSSDQFSDHNFNALLTAASYLQLHDLAALCRKKLKRNGRSLLSKPTTPTNGRTSRNQRLSSTPVTPNQMSGLKDCEKAKRHDDLLKDDLSEDEMFARNAHCVTAMSPSTSKNGSNGGCGIQELGLDLSKKSPSGSTATEEVSPSSIPQESPQSASESTPNSASFEENANMQNLAGGEPMELGGGGECEASQPPPDIDQRKSSRQVARQRRQAKGESNKGEDVERGTLPNGVAKRLNVAGERLPGGGNGNSETSFQCKEEEEGLENGQEQSEDSGHSESEGGRNSANYVYRQEGFEPALGDNLYVCIPCGKGFPSSEELNAHVETHTEEELYIKEEDDESYPKEDEVEAEDLSSQISHGHGTESRRFSCSVCNKSYKDPATLRQHEKTHWLTRPFPCNICGKMFTQRGTMTRHMRSHLGLKPFACEECGMRFTRQYRLTEHMRVHSGEKPYECQLCGGKFTQQRNLISHLRMHTSPS